MNSEAMSDWKGGKWFRPRGTHHDQDNSPAEVARKVNLAATNIAMSIMY